MLTKLERRYPEFDGLNLTWESLEGVIKHNGPLVTADKPLAKLPAAFRDYEALQSLGLDTYRRTGGAGRGAGGRHRVQQSRHPGRAAGRPVRDLRPDGRAACGRRLPRM